MGFKQFFIGAIFLAVFSCNTKNQSAVIQKVQDEKYLLKKGDLSVIVDSNLGARILSAKFGGNEVLLQESEGLMNWGSTFWPAPQSKWNWPPPAAMHIGLYSAEIQGNILITESAADTVFGLRTIKAFSFCQEENCLEIEYKIINDSDSIQAFGPWEITCVPAGGIVFFPYGELPENTENNLKIEIIDGIGFFKYEPEKLEPWHKVFNNTSEGWLAHVNEDNVLFVKSFEKIPANEIAPGQGNVELYVSKNLEYMELENHGVYSSMQPEDSLSYQVKWFFYQLPKGEVNFDSDLVNLIRSVIKM